MHTDQSRDSRSHRQESARRYRVLTPGQTLDLRITLIIASIQSAITVSAEAPVLDVAGVGPSTLVDQTSVATLPLNGRRFSDPALTTPATSVDPERGQIFLCRTACDQFQDQHRRRGL